jgi:fucose permease
MGLIGTYLLVMIQAMLSDHYGSLRAVALTESNVAASLSVALAPLIIGFGEQMELTWRFGILVGVGAWLALAISSWRVALPSGHSATQTARSSARPLSRRFWLYWVVIALGVAVEWCVVYWGADFLENSVGLDKVSASTLMSVFFVAVVIGRALGSRLTRAFDSSRLLIGAIAVVGAGFPFFWLAQAAPLNIAGLFVVGLGIANLYPLGLSVATSAAPEQASLASARISLASGSAILIAPQVLASFADHVGIAGAFGVAAALLVVVAVTAVMAQRTSVASAAVP